MGRHLCLFGVSVCAGLGTMPPRAALAMNPMRAVTPVGGGDTPGSGVASVGSSVTALLANLLPQANTGLFTGAQGIYVGEGLPPVLANKISVYRHGRAPPRILGTSARGGPAQA